MRIRYVFDDVFVAQEQQLLAVAEQLHGPDLGAVLVELARGFAFVDGLFDADWRQEDVGGIIECVGPLLGAGQAGSERPDAFVELGLGQLRRWLFTALLLALPIEQLPAALQERRLQAELGL